jgi:glycosyltransferase involved in cell wall biosynthesis
MRAPANHACARGEADVEAIDLTVVMLTRDRADLLPLSLAHLEIQTFPAGRFEILVVDQGSTDQTAEILERYSGGAPVRTRYLATESQSPAAARNRGLELSTGRWVLFLDDDLLAGPNLVRAHVAAQGLREGACAVVGRVDPHPQIAPATFMRRYELDPSRRLRQGQPLRFLDWRAWNLSLPRMELLEAGGFDEEFMFQGLEDLELAWRLEGHGLPGVYAEEARAYVWRPAAIDAERQRAYAEGYSLHTVLEKTQSNIVRERYLSRLTARSALTATLLLPFEHRACSALAPDTRLFRFLHRRVVRGAFSRGYTDASSGRPPRPLP